MHGYGPGCLTGVAGDGEGPILAKDAEKKLTSILMKNLCSGKVEGIRQVRGYGAGGSAGGVARGRATGGLGAGTSASVELQLPARLLAVRTCVISREVPLLVVT